MKRTKWHSIRLLDLDTNRFEDGRWRIEMDEYETRLRVKISGGESSDWMTPGLSMTAYRELAEQACVSLRRARKTA